MRWGTPPLPLATAQPRRACPHLTPPTPPHLSPAPQARYISLQSYDATREPYAYSDCQFVVPARLTDFQLYRDPSGGINPFRPMLEPNATEGVGACTADADGSYTVTLTCAGEGSPAGTIGGRGSLLARTARRRAAPELTHPHAPSASCAAPTC